MKKIILFLILSLFSFPLQAADISKLNRQVELSKEQFEARAKLIEEKPLNNQYLAFRIKLPKNWTKFTVQDELTQSDLSKQILGDISQYLGPPTLDLRSSFRLRANDLPFELTAKDWFTNYMMINNFSLQGMDVSSDKRIQAHYVMIENGLQYVVRAAVQISGPRIILAEYIVPIELWPAERDMAIWSMASFLLTDPDPAPVEALATHPFVDIAKFSYPSSWLLKAAPISSIERMSASLLNLKGGIPASAKARVSSNDLLLMDGRIEVMTVSKTPEITLLNEVVLLKKQLLEKGLVLGELIEPVKGWPHDKALIFSRIEVYEINP